MALSDIDAELTALGIDPEKDSPAPVEPPAPKPVETPTPVVDTPPAAPATPPDLLEQLLTPPVSTGEPPAPVDDAGDDTPVPKNLTAHAGEAFKRIRDENKSLRLKLKELEAAPASAPSGELDAARAELTAAKAELDRLRQENGEFVKELSISRVEATPEYKRAVIEPTEAVRATAEKLATKYGLEPTILTKAVLEADPDRQAELLVEAGSSFNDLDRSRLYRLGEAFQDIVTQKARLAGNAKLALEEIESRRTVEAEEARRNYAQNMSSFANKSWSKLQETVPVLRKVEGNDEWNASIDKLHALATTTDPESLNPETRLQSLQHALVLPLVVQLLQRSFAESSALKKQVAELSAATPGAGGGGQTAPSPKTSDVSEGGFFEAIEAAMR